MKDIEMVKAEGNPTEDVQKTAFSGGVGWTIQSRIIIASTTMSDMLKSLVKFIICFPEPENISDSSGDPSDSEIPVMGAMEKQELSKAIFQLGVNLNVGLVAMRREQLDSVEQLIVVANSTGCAMIYNGLLLRECTPTFARTAELVGVGIIFAGIHLLFSIHLIWCLRIILVVCCAFCMRPLVMAEVFAKTKKGKKCFHISDNGDEAVLTSTITVATE